MNTRYVEIPGTNMLRDTYNMSLINNDKSELENYQNKRNFLLQQKNEINSIKDEVNQIKTSITELKELIINNLKG